MNKAGKLRLFLLFAVLLFSVLMAGHVETDLTPNAQIREDSIQPIFTFVTSAVDEDLHVNAFDSTSSFTTMGSGYTALNAIDDDIIETKIDNQIVQWFDFPATTATGDANVEFFFYGWNQDGAGNDHLDIIIDYTGSGAGTEYEVLWGDHLEGDAVQESYDSGSHTVAEINLCRIGLIFHKVTAADEVACDQLYMNVVQSGGAAYEKDLTETVTAADVKATAADYDRELTESVSAVDVKTTTADFIRNLTESITVVGIISVAKLTTKDMFEAITASDVKTTAADYVRNLTESASSSDTIIKTIGLNMIEAIPIVDLIDTFKGGGGTNYEKNLTETISASDVKTTGADYIRNLVESVSSSAVMTRSIDIVRDLVESVNVVELIDTSDGGVNYERKLTEVVVVSFPRNESLFYQLFYSLNMWGYIGPTALVIGGYIASKKEKFIGVIFFIVYCLVIATYLSLISVTPAYWWNVIILILGVVLITSSLMSNR